MGVTKIHTAICTCDGCGVCTDMPVDYGTTAIEGLPTGWLMLEIKTHIRHDCGYTSSPAECLTVCSKSCAGIALNARIRHV